MCGVGVFVGRVPNTVLEPNFADHSGRRFCKLGFVYFHESKTCATYGPRAEDVVRRIRNDLADAYETS